MPEFQNFSIIKKIGEGAQGVVYLAKDSFMTKEYFKKTYNDLDKFLQFKREIDPQNKLTSFQSKRLDIS